jgi:hypothetical protein
MNYIKYIDNYLISFTKLQKEEIKIYSKVIKLKKLLMKING